MIGIDLGSRNVKIIVMQERQIIKRAIYDTIDFYRLCRRTANNSLIIDFAGMGLPADRVVATGYGKVTVQIAGALQLPEIQAHAAGALFQTGLTDFTVLDIGGQDTKVIKVAGSRVVDFLTNDRCAASSGRFMENMAAVLKIPLADLGNYYDDPIDINSTCAIFTETEIIGRIVEGCSLEQLAAGVNYTLFKRIMPLLSKLRSDTVLLSGGGALNTAISTYIYREMGCCAQVLPQPQYNGAIGCCLYGCESVRKETGKQEDGRRC